MLAEVECNRCGAKVKPTENGRCPRCGKSLFLVQPASDQEKLTAPQGGQKNEQKTLEDLLKLQEIRSFGRAGVLETRFKTDELVCSQIIMELRKAENFLKEARLVAYEKKMEKLLTSLQSVGRRVDVFAKEVASVDYGPSPYFKKMRIPLRNIRRTVDFDERILHKVSEINDLARDIYQKVSDDEEKKLSNLAQKLGLEVTICQNDFSDRQKYLEGIK